MTGYLLVEVTDERRAREIAEQIEQGTDGVRAVYEHNERYPNGCCCQHCPHGGNCRD